MSFLKIEVVYFNGNILNFIYDLNFSTFLSGFFVWKEHVLFALQPRMFSISPYLHAFFTTYAQEDLEKKSVWIGLKAQNLYRVVSLTDVNPTTIVVMPFY